MQIMTIVNGKLYISRGMLMPELSREGHRERMRKSYLIDGFENAPDYQVLELFLSLVIPRKDVKPVSYNLMNAFGSLENILDAKPQALMKVDGVGESTAVAISLIRVLNARAKKNKNDNITKILDSDDAIEYCNNLLSEETVERFCVVLLANNGKVINHRLFRKCTVNTSKVDTAEIFDYISLYNVSAIIIAHNHPMGNCTPSHDDLNFTINFKYLLSKSSIKLHDHVIVGENSCYSMAKDPEYLTFFD